MGGRNWRNFECFGCLRRSPIQQSNRRANRISNKEHPMHANLHTRPGHWHSSNGQQSQGKIYSRKCKLCLSKLLFTKIPYRKTRRLLNCLRFIAVWLFITRNSTIKSGARNKSTRWLWKFCHTTIRHLQQRSTKSSASQSLISTIQSQSTYGTNAMRSSFDGFFLQLLILCPQHGWHG